MIASAMQFWRDPALGSHGVDLLIARNTRHRYASHFHAEYVVSVFEAGAQRRRVHGHEAVATPGHLVLIRPGEPHTAEPGMTGGSWSHIAFYPDVQTLHRVADAIFSGPDLRVIDFDEAGMGDRPTNWHIAARHRVVSDGGAEPMERQQAFAEAMELLLLRYAAVGRAPRSLGGEGGVLRKAIACMRQRLEEPDLSIGDLAEVAGLSPFHFMRSFRRNTGMTAHNFLVQLRLNAARDRLSRGAPAAEVALECGFFDQSHLIRHFRKAHGVTPGSYTKRIALSR